MSGIIAQNSGRHTGLVKASSGGGGVWNLILTQTASASSTIDFTSDIDSTYDEYVFKFIDIHPSDHSSNLGFQVNVSGQSGFNETVTSTFPHAWHNEADSIQGVAYHADFDQAQGTAYQPLARELGNEDDESTAGTLHLFNPSSTTFVKHFYSCFSGHVHDDAEKSSYMAGYFNVTGAIDEVSFKMSGGEIDAGQISLYGIS